MSGQKLLERAAKEWRARIGKLSPEEYAAECDRELKKANQRRNSGKWLEFAASRRFCFEPRTPEQQHEWQVRAARRAIDAALDEEQERLNREQQERDDCELMEILKQSRTAGTLSDFNRKFLESCETEDVPTWLQ